MPPRLRSPNFSSVSSCPSVRPQSIAQPARAARDFSQSSCRQVTQRRRKFYEWLNGPGRALKQPLPGSTNYLGAYDKFGNLVRGGTMPEKAPEKPKEGEAAAKEGAEGESAPVVEGQESADELDAALRQHEKEEQATKKDDENKLPPETAEDLRPFPLNKFFRSQPVLSEELREAIYQFVVKEGKTVPLASITFGVSNERVGAVVRLKQMEKQWIAQGKTLAMPYSKAVLEMVPTTPYIDTSLPKNAGKRPVVHEPINDLIVHPATRQQLFVPVAESRHFTREDAGKAFDNNLLPADERIPHPELVKVVRDEIAGYSNEERRALAQERYREAAEKKKAAEDAKRKEELETRRTVPQRRWDFVFQDVSVEDAGRDGRSHKGVGWRYGLPHEDRKKGQVKIPTKVEA
ncbi:uncharacterized protein N0V89_004779 [Didymosphaeria variabile]|uniref:Ribosomal protein S35, mitochondrial n=1 Tax=Didymosphaeria variabile TaxID=1932322 RepID=A0A9W8XQ17_9PLEO|nr:uncharacterized protein N0V89_004779 [Didymosphaeria variabile]KAJ4356743.1 hypothetical protein N0V89_004779 [Didymosphaeria variabile]